VHRERFCRSIGLVQGLDQGCPHPRVFGPLEQEGTQLGNDLRRPLPPDQQLDSPFDDGSPPLEQSRAGWSQDAPLREGQVGAVPEPQRGLRRVEGSIVVRPTCHVGKLVELIDVDAALAPRQCVTAGVVRRQSDGSWRFVIDNPTGINILPGAFGEEGE